MSVILLNKENFKKNIEGLASFSYKFLYGKHLYRDELKPIFNILYKLNQKSYNTRYKDGADLEELNFKGIKTIEEHKNICSLLKSLECLRYQMDDEELKLDYQEQRAIKFLDDMIQSITSHLISNLEDYKVANWQ